MDRAALFSEERIQREFSRQAVYITKFNRTVRLVDRAASGFLAFGCAIWPSGDSELRQPCFVETATQATIRCLKQQGVPGAGMGLHPRIHNRYAAPRLGMPCIEATVGRPATGRRHDEVARVQIVSMQPHRRIDVHVAVINRYMRKVGANLFSELSIRGSDLDPEAEKFLWPVWDRLRLLAEKREVTSVGANAINAAINHPFGNLAEVLIKRFWAAKPEPNQGLGTLASRFTAITSASGDGAWCGRVILGTALNPLFVVDPTWTTENLIPHFNWEKAEDAPLLWDGYLSSPRPTVSLLARLKPQLLEAFRQIERLDNWASLCALLAAIGLEGAGEVTAEEVRESIRTMGAKGRHELTAWIVRRMRPPGPADSSQTEPEGLATERKTRARFFAERAIPWLMSVWPPEKDTVDDTVSANVAIASIWAGDAYPKAVKELRFFWKKTKDPDMLLRDLRESKQAENFPTETLELLYLLIGDPLHLFAATELQAVLHGLSLANPKLTDDLRYASLRDAAISASA
jgi:hypothetical protein